MQSVKDMRGKDEFLQFHIRVMWIKSYLNLHLRHNHRKGLIKMKGYTIDCRYVVRVSDLMKISKLPRPRKKLLDSDGSKLKLITVECEV